MQWGETIEGNCRTIRARLVLAPVFDSYLKCFVLPFVKQFGFLNRKENKDPHHVLRSIKLETGDTLMGSSVVE